VKHRLLLLAPLCLAAAVGDYHAARRKFDLIESGRLPPGRRIELSAAELNAYLTHEVAGEIGEGVRNPRLRLGNRIATGEALIDFGLLRRAHGPPTGFLLGKLLDGERPVRVTATIHSSGGAATVNLQSVEISGVAIQGRALDFLIHRFLLPRYPNAAIGRPFPLGNRIDHLEVNPGAAIVVIGP
jgi:hypothetical protein